MQHRRDAPNGNRNRVTQLCPDTVDYFSVDQLAKRVAGGKGHNNPAIIRFRPAENSFEFRLQEPKDLPVYVIDGGSRKQQKGNEPSIISNFCFQNNSRVNCSLN